MHLKIDAQAHTIPGPRAPPRRNELPRKFVLAAIRQQLFCELIFSIHKSLNILLCAVKKRKGNVWVMTNLCFVQQNVLYFLEVHCDL